MSLVACTPKNTFSLWFPAVSTQQEDGEKQHRSSLQGAVRSISILQRGRRLEYKIYYRSFLPGVSHLDIQLQVLISRIGKLFDCNWFLNVLQAVIFHSPVTQSIQSYPSVTEYVQFHFPLVLSRLNEHTISNFHFQHRSMQIPCDPVPDS